MNHQCIACGKKDKIVKTLNCVSVDNSKITLPIDFCECGLGRTRLQNINNSTLLTDKQYYKLEYRLKIYYYYLYHHFTVRYNETLRNIKKYKEHGQLLEVGANIGFTANLAKKFGYEVTACEINEDCRKFIKLVFNLPTLGDLFDINEKYDIITLCDVLEHFSNPAKAIEKIDQILDPDGICFIQLPNVECSSAIKKGEKWNFYIPPDHIYHFSVKTLTMLIENYGFKVIWCRTVSFIEDYRIINCLPQKMREKIIYLLYNNPFYWPGVYKKSENKGSSIQMIISKK